MSIYTEVPMMTWGNVPTTIVEVPVSIPVPFIPDWVKILLGVLAVVLVICFILWLIERAKTAKCQAEITRLKVAAMFEESKKTVTATTTPWNNSPPS